MVGVYPVHPVMHQRYTVRERAVVFRVKLFLSGRGIGNLGLMSSKDCAGLSGVGFYKPCLCFVGGVFLVEVSGVPKKKIPNQKPPQNKIPTPLIGYSHSTLLMHQRYTVTRGLLYFKSTFFPHPHTRCQPLFSPDKSQHTTTPFTMQTLRMLAVMCSLALVVAVDEACVASIIQSVADIATTAEEISEVAKVCKNATQVECLANVRTASTACAALVDQGTRTVSTCDDKVSGACTADVNSVALSLSQAANGITLAITDCANGETKNTGDCVIDVLDTATFLSEAGLQIYHATLSCKAGGANTTACVPDVLATIAKSRGAMRDIKSSVIACKGKSGCTDAILTAINSVGITAQYGEKAAESCGAIEKAGCVADVTDSVSLLLESAGAIKDAYTHCQNGIFKIECLTRLEAVASEVSRAVMDVVKATSACRKF